MVCSALRCGTRDEDRTDAEAAALAGCCVGNGFGNRTGWNRCEQVRHHDTRQTAERLWSAAMRLSPTAHPLQIRTEKNYGQLWPVRGAVRDALV